MMDLVKYFFGDLFHFIGLCVFVIVVAMGLELVAAQFRRR